MFSVLPNWHPIFVHFTVALFLTSIGLFAAARFAPTAAWRGNALIVARWNLWRGYSDIGGDHESKHEH